MRRCGLTPPTATLSGGDGEGTLRASEFSVHEIAWLRHHDVPQPSTAIMMPAVVITAHRTTLALVAMWPATSITFSSGRWPPCAAGCAEGPIWPSPKC